MTFPKERPQKALSRKLLKNALLTLMTKTPYHTITVCALCEQAGVSRRTFYRHYTGIDDVLQQILHEFAAQTADMMVREAVHRMVGFTVPYFKFMSGRLPLLRLLKKNDLLPQLSQCIREEMQGKFPIESNGEPNIFYDWGFSIIFGMIWMLMLRWLEEGANRSPEEMKNIMEAVVIAMVQGREFSIL